MSCCVVSDQFRNILALLYLISVVNADDMPYNFILHNAHHQNHSLAEQQNIYYAPPITSLRRMGLSQKSATGRREIKATEL